MRPVLGASAFFVAGCDLVPCCPRFVRSAPWRLTALFTACCYALPWCVFTRGTLFNALIFRALAATGLAARLWE